MVWCHVVLRVIPALLWKIERSSRPEVFCKKGVIKNFTKFKGKHLYQSLFLIKLHAWACNFIKKETLAQVFSCKFCQILKNTYFYRIPLVAASELKSKHIFNSATFLNMSSKTIKVFSTQISFNQESIKKNLIILWKNGTFIYNLVSWWMEC